MKNTKNTQLNDLQKIAKRFQKGRPKTALSETTARREVALLPHHLVKTQLEEHSIVKLLKIDAHKVYRCITEVMIVLDEDNGLKEGCASQKNVAKHPPFAQVMSYCCNRQAEKDSKSSAWVCPCGIVQSSVICYSNPYRNFDDKLTGDRCHWTEISDNKDLDEMPEIHQIMPYAFDGRSSVVQLSKAEDTARSYKLKFGTITHRMATAAAVWILLENPNILRNGVTPCKDRLPKGIFTCKCGDMFHRGIDFRIHKKFCVR